MLFDHFLVVGMALGRVFSFDDFTHLNVQFDFSLFSHWEVEQILSGLQKLDIPPLFSWIPCLPHSFRDFFGFGLLDTFFRAFGLIS